MACACDSPHLGDREIPVQFPKRRREAEAVGFRLVIVGEKCSWIAPGSTGVSYRLEIVKEI